MEPNDKKWTSSLEIVEVIPEPRHPFLAVFYRGDKWFAVDVQYYCLAEEVLTDTTLPECVNMPGNPYCGVKREERTRFVAGIVYNEEGVFVISESESNFLGYERKGQIKEKKVVDHWTAEVEKINKIRKGKKK